MIRQIENIRKTRLALIERLKYVNIDELNRIPSGFNNNIIWNLGHIIAVQQGICYKKAGATSLVDDVFLEKYKPGSVPKVPAEPDEVTYIKTLLLTSIDQLEADSRTRAFDTYTVWTTAYGLEIKNINDAIDFESFHGGLHFGVIVAMTRILQSLREKEIL